MADQGFLSSPSGGRQHPSKSPSEVRLIESPSSQKAILSKLRVERLVLHREDERITTLLKLWTDSVRIARQPPAKRDRMPAAALLALATRVVPRPAFDS